MKNTLIDITCLTLLQESSHFTYNHATIIIQALKQEGYEPHIMISMGSGVVSILESAPLKEEHLQQVRTSDKMHHKSNARNITHHNTNIFQP